MTTRLLKPLFAGFVICLATAFVPNQAKANDYDNMQWYGGNGWHASNGWHHGWYYNRGWGNPNSPYGYNRRSYLYGYNPYSRHYRQWR